MMEVIPSIDLRGGLCVRLYQGDFNKETVYSQSPINIAKQWYDLGATRLHIVDLDGTKDESSPNIQIIEEIAALKMPLLQVGGGIRSLDIANRLLEAGVDRIVIGTIAIENPDLISQICQKWGANRIVIAVDARNELVSIRGWTKQTSVSATDLILQMSKLGINRFLYTDIKRDGTLTEPNFDAIYNLVQNTNQNILASGGVSTLDHLRQLSTSLVEGAIIGKALYEGNIKLDQAVALGKSLSKNSGAKKY